MRRTASDTELFVRPDGRTPPQHRPLRIQREFLTHAEGSALVTQGQTRVICAASVSAALPEFRRGTGGGWITAEYGMLPRATATRAPRGALPTGKRAVEISRFLGRCLRAVVDLDLLGPTMIHIDCDVVDADGGTRCAALTGAFVALRDAIATLRGGKGGPAWPVREPVAGISVAFLDGRLLVDPDYDEDRRADIDLTLALTESGRLVEIHAASEAEPYSRETLECMIEAAVMGAQSTFLAQHTCQGDAIP